MEERVVLVNERDEQIGTMEKQEAHVKALLHRAISIFVFNDRRELMVHQRAFHKYHSGGLWTNTACSHPRPDESVLAAAHRRLQEEMGFDCELEQAFSFIYKAELDQGLTEHELDHVLIGKYEGVPVLNPEEVADWKWMSLEKLEDELRRAPELYTEWFKIVFAEVVTYISRSK